MKYILILATIFFLQACNHTGQTEIRTVEKQAEEHHHPGKSSSNLSLNGTDKWKADQPTFEQVKKLQTQANLFAGNAPYTPDEYKVAGVNLQTGINTLTRECKMKGAEHEALHHWLEPLIQQVTALKAAETTKAGQKSLNEVQLQLELFDQYFEQ